MHRGSGTVGGPARGSERRRLRPWLAVAIIVATVTAASATVLAVSGPRLASHPAGSAGAAAKAAADPSGPAPGHEVYGFVPYWELDADIGAHLRLTGPSTVALFSITHTKQGRIATNLSGYKKIHGPIGREIIADAHAAKRRVDVTWTSFGRAKNALLFGSSTLQDKVIQSLVRARADLDVDGIAVDVEGLDATAIPAFGAFVGRLRTALIADSPAATVTVATGAGPHGAAMAVAATAAGADRIFLMGYDYRTGSSDPGGSAPIARRDRPDHSLSWSLDVYAAAGIPAERLLLGLPLYGLAWATDSGELGAAASGPGRIWVPRRNVATLADPAAVTSYDVTEGVSFVATPAGDGFQAVYYDTPESLRPKLKLANDHRLAGAGFWALGYERGLPGYAELITAFADGEPITSSAAAPRASAPAGSAPHGSR